MWTIEAFVMKDAIGKLNYVGLILFSGLGNGVLPQDFLFVFRIWRESDVRGEVFSWNILLLFYSLRKWLWISQSVWRLARFCITKLENLALDGKEHGVAT